MFTINFILWLLGLGVVAVSLWLLFDEHLYLQVRASLNKNFNRKYISLVGHFVCSDKLYVIIIKGHHCKILTVQTMSDQRTDYYLGTYIILGIGSLVTTQYTSSI